MGHLSWCRQMIGFFPTKDTRDINVSNVSITRYHTIACFTTITCLWFTFYVLLIYWTYSFRSDVFSMVSAYRFCVGSVISFSSCFRLVFCSCPCPVWTYTWMFITWHRFCSFSVLCLLLYDILSLGMVGALHYSSVISFYSRISRHQILPWSVLNWWVAI